MRIAFIGGGAMGEAMITAVLDKGLASPPEICVSDAAEARRAYLAGKYAITVAADNRAAVGQGQVVILAVKPQNLRTVMSELNGLFKRSQLLLSIIAGARIDTMRSGFGHARIVRVMPNTPAQIGEGMSVWTATAEVTGEQRDWARSILSAMGREIFAAEEKYLDMATAVSGSGPAYVFLFMEALIDAGVHIGLSRETAIELVFQTVLGAVRFAQKSDKPIAELRRMVTSPGGTTAEALARFEEGQFNDLVRRAVTAAYEKAKKLGS